MKVVDLREIYNIDFFTPLFPKVLGSQVIILRTHGHETKYLVKFCPNLVRILTQLHGTFSFSYKGNIQKKLKYGFYSTLQAFQNVQELLEIILE